MHFSSLLCRTLYLMFLYSKVLQPLKIIRCKQDVAALDRPIPPKKKGNTEENTSIDLDSCFEGTILVYVILIIKTVCRISYAFLSIKF